MNILVLAISILYALVHFAHAQKNLDPAVLKRILEALQNSNTVKVTTTPANPFVLKYEPPIIHKLKDDHGIVNRLRQNLRKIRKSTDDHILTPFEKQTNTLVALTKSKDEVPKPDTRTRTISFNSRVPINHRQVHLLIPNQGNPNMKFFKPSGRSAVLRGQNVSLSTKPITVKLRVLPQETYRQKPLSGVPGQRPKQLISFIESPQMNRRFGIPNLSPHMDTIPRTLAYSAPTFKPIKSYPIVQEQLPPFFPRLRRMFTSNVQASNYAIDNFFKIRDTRTRTRNSRLQRY